MLNTQEKVELLTSAEVVGDANRGGPTTAKCPITGHGATNSGANGNAVSQCPFANKRSTSSTAAFPTMLQANGVDSCPFMSSIKMVDCDENKNFIDMPSVVSDSGDQKCSEADDSVKLYCGLICHKTIDHKVLESCELLGRQLAEKLIGRGALDVMKVAQNIIHSKIN